MRTHGSVTALSWIPSEAVEGPARAAFDVGLTHYDAPPADEVGGLQQLEEMANADAFRFANRLAAWIDVEDGRVLSGAYASDSQGVMGGSTVRLGPWSARMSAIKYPVIRHEPQLEPEAATFVQTVGGRAALPAPRKVDRRPFVQVVSPVVWTTLRLTIRADGGIDSGIEGASTFPRHWIYGDDGKLRAQSGTTNFTTWFHQSFGEWTPWGGHDAAAIMSPAETALEREVSKSIMGSKHRPQFRTLRRDEVLTTQGTPGRSLFLVLDGLLSIDVDGQRRGELGPGALIGERAYLETGVRTATLTALTNVRVATFPPEDVDADALSEICLGHR